MNWTEFTAVALIHLLAVASPGPDFAIVVRQSLHYGRNSALATSLGIGVGILVHVAYSLIGLSVVIATTPWLFNVIKYLATGYLLYLAWGAIRAQPAAPNSDSDTSGNQAHVPTTLYKSFTIGFITNGINPKATLFFLSLFTLVIDPSTALNVKLFYGGYLAMATAAWFCFLSMILNHNKVIYVLRHYSYWVDRAMGALLIVVALGILFT
ncbi:LysE family translocator [Alteromonas sediminis]|uniref:LysE family translocator n=1 Tax=Alteromonas sediminis TaxID=2259342 RepID=A0A3N5YNW2_9ALTE|nr:LysE family transporter [Alteromonas sediminis]RPJ67411.1 LysE family translocator [Alteromonas sediminis]